MVFQELGIYNNLLYVKLNWRNEGSNTIEILSEADRYNEYIMTGCEQFEAFL
jgi:hypothetical protein